MPPASIALLWVVVEMVFDALKIERIFPPPE
jgi:hypothetical protein